jgi:hypothetical protein
MPEPRRCGSCTLCCKVLGISVLDKPAGSWCRHCVPGQGCGIYADRPDECASFACLWLADPHFPDALKPDRSKVVFALEPGGNRVNAWVDPAAKDAWKTPDVYGLLKRLATLGMRLRKQVLVRLGEDITAILPDRDVPLGPVKPGQIVEYYPVNERMLVRVTGAA